jgi:fructose-bisphosphate aldolase class II
MTEVLNSQDTAPLAIETILKAGSYDLGLKVTRIEDPAEWTESKIAEKASRLGTSKGPAGKFDD